MKISAYKDFILKEGDMLFRDGDKVDYVYLIKNGEIITLKENDGRLFPLGVFTTQDFVGAINTINGGKVRESAIAKSKCVLTPIPTKDISKVVDACDDWVADVLSNITQRLQGSFNLVAEHKLVLDNCEIGENFTDEDEAKYRKVLDV
jgi:CRP-like cAMP-binding protein